MRQKNLKMTETLAYGYSCESTQQGLSNEYQHGRVKMVFKKSLHPCDLDESNLNFGRVNPVPLESIVCYSHTFEDNLNHTSFPNSLKNCHARFCRC